MTTLLIHGYNFDLAAGDDPETQYQVWRNFVPETPAQIIPWRWQSTPAGGAPEAWLSGHWNTYHWAWSEAVREAQKVQDWLSAQPGPVNVVCHSLGSRVAYEAMAWAPNKVKRVLTLNGADSVGHARSCIQQAWKVGGSPEVLSVMTKDDDVLQWMGRIFTPVWGKEHVVGYDGLGEPWPRGWHEYDPGTLADGPGRGDHSWTFKNQKLWPRWRAWLEGWSYKRVVG